MSFADWTVLSCYIVIWINIAISIYKLIRDCESHMWVFGSTMASSILGMCIGIARGDLLVFVIWCGCMLYNINCGIKIESILYYFRISKEEV